jgi:hypothetical protein
MKQTFKVTKIVTRREFCTRVNTGCTRGKINLPVFNPTLMLQGLMIGSNIVNTVNTGTYKDFNTNIGTRRNNGVQKPKGYSNRFDPCSPVFKIKNIAQSLAVIDSVCARVNPCSKPLSEKVF